MAMAVFMTWPGVTAEQYEQLRQIVNWERDLPTGARFHVAAFDEHGAHITDLWATGEDFQRFVDERLMPGVAQVGIAGQPQLDVIPAHAVFTPGFAEK